MNHNLSLYADDLLLYMSNSENSIPHLVEVFKLKRLKKEFQVVFGRDVSFDPT